MRKKIKISFLFILTCLLSFHTNGQDVQYSHYYANPLLLAPSFAGATAGSRITLNYRNQWTSMPKSYVTYDVSYDQFLAGLKSGIGFSLKKDVAGSGELGTFKGTFHYSYSVDINDDWILCPGINFSYSETSVDLTKLLFVSQNNFDDNLNLPSNVYIPFEKVSNFDAAVSGIAYSKRYWGGLTLDHLIRPNQSLLGYESRIPVKLEVFGGAKFGIRNMYGNKGKESIYATLLYKSQGKFDQLNTGAYWFKMPLMFGLWYRGLPVIKSYNGYWNHDAVIFLFGYKIKDVSIQYSYDFTISKAFPTTGGSSELTIIYVFFQNIKHKKRVTEISCPKFGGAN